MIGAPIMITSPQKIEFLVHLPQICSMPALECLHFMKFTSHTGHNVPSAPHTVPALHAQPRTLLPAGPRTLHNNSPPFA